MDRFEVLHGEGLSPGHVHAGRQRDVGDPVGAGVIDKALQLL